MAKKELATVHVNKITLPNTQKPSGLSRENTIEVHHVFDTIQGEGPLAGTPSVFVRLYGCNLQCPSCFHGRTSIRMADFSTKLISEVREGDMVLSYDEESGKFVPKKVVRTMQRKTNKIYRLNTGGPATFVTGEHPMLVRDKGWTEIKNLQIGDHILRLTLSELRTLHNPMKRPEIAAKVSKTMKDGIASGKYQSVWDRMSDEQKQDASESISRRMTENNPMKDPAIAIKAFLNRKDRGEMTPTEKFLLTIADEIGIKLQFTGGGDLVVGFKVPDFLIEGTNKLIEVWDRTMKTFEEARGEEYQKSRRKIFEKEGYEVLFLPLAPMSMGDEIGTRKPERKMKRDKHVRIVKRKLAEYARNGDTVKGIEKISAKLNPKAWTRLAGTLSAPLTVYNLEVEDTHTYIADGKIAHNCDTDYTSENHVQQIGEVVASIQALRKTGLVVITGGEPFRQKIGPLVLSLLNNGYTVQIETNGMLYHDELPYGREDMWIVCSPKNPSVHHRLEKYIDAFKFVVEDGNIDPLDGLPTKTLGNDLEVYRPSPEWLAVHPNSVFIQPLDTQDEKKNLANMKAAIATCRQFGYRLGSQNHKSWGLE